MSPKAHGSADHGDALTPALGTPSTAAPTTARTYPKPITLNVCMTCGDIVKTKRCKNCGATKPEAWVFIGARRA